MSDAVTRLNAALQGRYRIERELGAGGMATVYLARDEKHNRNVALKVLKPELAAVVGAERFLAEIETTANLQHPHILPLFDSGEADGFLFYVMPYVEGETLRDRLDRVRQLPVDEAVSIAKAVAQALQHAHDRGVIHRDIKPGNILIQDGQPVVSDFGIALAVGAAGGARLTETGLSVGTPYYMSPEQATGDVVVGPASDIYALGCVLYEMLVGDPPYIGSTAQAVLGKIIQGAPVSATGVRKSVPANVDAAIRRALEKLPADRFTGAHDFAKALADPGFVHGPGAVAGGVDGAPSAPMWRRALPWGLAVALAVLALVQALQPGTADTVGVVRFTIPIPAEDSAAEPGPTFLRGPVREVALSPDGEVLVYRAGAFPGRLYMRRLDQDAAVEIPGTDGGTVPTFSPDGAWIAFIDIDELIGDDSRPLKRVSLSDGRIETIAPLPESDPPGITWGDDGTIVINSDEALYRVRSSGGEWETIAESVTAETGEDERYGEPTMLPGSRALLFHVRRSFNPADAEVVALDLAAGAMTTVMADAMSPTYVPTGHLLFLRQATLMAVRFDAERLEAVGQPVAVSRDVMQALYMYNTSVETGAAQVAVSSNGHLVYAAGGVAPEEVRPVIRITPAGDTVPVGLEGRQYGGLRVSPDGTRLAMTIGHGAIQSDLWIHDLVRGVTERLNTGSFDNWPLEWTPDGGSIVFSAGLDQALENLYRIPIDGSAAPERLAASPDGQTVTSVSIDGAVAYRSNDDLWVLSPDGDEQPFVVSEGVSERFGVFSADGRWLAYSSDRTGTSEAYIRPYPGPGPPVLLTSGGATNLAWSRDGRRLYYVAPRSGAPGALMSVDITLGESVVVGTPRVELEAFTHSTTPTRSYDVLEDGSIITVREEDNADADGVSELHVVLNFFDELRERLPN